MRILNLTLNEFTDGLEQVVEYVHWDHNGVRGNTKLNPPKENFVPFSELTEEAIIAWVWDQDRAKIEKFLKNKKDSQKVSLGETPELSEKAQTAKQEYWTNWATKRLQQHILLEGRSEVREMQPTGEQVFNEETGEMEDVLQEVLVQTAIDPVEEFVEISAPSENPEAEPTLQTVRNPIVVKDEEERAKALEILETYNDR